MKNPITVKIEGSGILVQEIILTALQEYRHMCNESGNYSRADVVSEIINRIEF